MNEIRRKREKKISDRNTFINNITDDEERSVNEKFNDCFEKRMHTYSFYREIKRIRHGGEYSFRRGRPLLSWVKDKKIEIKKIKFNLSKFINNFHRILRPTGYMNNKETQKYL